MIRVLEKHVADKIAAGEVVDRPVSIVKELVENAIDAGAGSITVEIRKGGKEYIRVTDDGCGIPAEEVELAFHRHATSKIEAERDLDAIGTLGFRGEALASICAVSRLEMITRPAEARTGRRVLAEGSGIIANTATGCPPGTTITVRDLFYNLPARRKFLGSDQAEGRRIVDLMSRLALAYPDVKIRVINGKKDAFATSGKGVILDNVLRIYGRDLEKDLVPVDAARDGMVLRGFISSPGLSSASRSRQFFCVNGRVVASKTLERGLEKGYRERLFTGRFPLAFLFLSVPAHTLDVNVHPTKREIRFDEPFRVEDFVEEAVFAALQGADALVRGAGTGEALDEASDETRSDAPAGAGMAGDAPPDADGAENQAENRTGSQREKGAAPASGDGPSLPTFSDAQADDAKATLSAGGSTGSSAGDQLDIKNVLETMRRDQMREEETVYSASGSGAAGKKRLDIPALQVLGVALNTYIVTTDGECLYLIDQHAAHERVFYERFLREYRSEEKVRQSMLIPLQFTVSADVEAAEEDWIECVRRMGYHIEPFGERVYIVREMPAFMAAAEGEDFLRQFFLELEERPDLSRFATLDRLIIRSCKSAVKGGDKLHPEEIRALLEQLDACDNPWSCPHGRPTFVKMTRRDLERMFKRA